jgi:CPA2 family monovalent cation:H+ antiporter-2
LHHETTLISTIAIGFAVAFLFGMLAVRLRLPAIVGYLVAGMVVGPFTPGFVADAGLAQELAEIGVMLLMFGVGLHFSPRDLMAVRNIAIPGAVGQIAVATVMGLGLTALWGWPLGWGLVFGLSLSVASTVVLLRALEERGALDTANGRIAVGWLLVEDIAMVLALVLLPALAGPLGGETTSLAANAAGTNLWLSLGLTLLKVAAFVALMLVVGSRVVPWLLARVARLGSRELFTLSILALALGVAYGSAEIFGVSFALGAFFAGVVVGESDLSHHAASEALPLQDAFAVLFFVSVGMLFDPSIVVTKPWHLLGTVAVIVVGKSLAAAAIVLLFRYPLGTALLVSASLAQIGEFSFILAGLGVTLGLLPEEGYSLILAGALVSITLNPVVFRTVDPLTRWIRGRPGLATMVERPDDVLSALPVTVDEEKLHEHAVVVGYGRVGRAVVEALTENRIPYVIIEQSHKRVEELRLRGQPAIYGDATRPTILSHAHLPDAALMVVATPEPVAVREISERARALAPHLTIIARTHSDEEQAHLEGHGVAEAFMGERELAASIVRRALQHCGIPREQAIASARSLRRPTRLSGLAERGSIDAEA